jgi:DNA-binding transcriptional MerR regulator
VSARAAAEKTAEAFRTIGEVADLLGLQTHVLRFWEGRFPQIRPVKGAGGRRYYRPSDIALVRAIRWLLHEEGMTIRGVQKLLRERGVRHVAGLGDCASGAVVLAVAPEPAPAAADAPDVVARLVPRAPDAPPAVGPVARERPLRRVAAAPDAGQLALPGFSAETPPSPARSGPRRAGSPGQPSGQTAVADLRALYQRLQGLRDRMANA